MIRFGNMHSFAFPIGVFFGVVILGMLFIGHSHRLPRLAPEISEEKPIRILNAENIEEIIPSEWRKLPFSRKSNGWRKMGISPLGLEETWAEVTGLMSAQGYDVRMRIPQGEIADDVLAEFWDSSKRGRVMWSLRRVKSDETAFSWGIPK